MKINTFVNELKGKSVEELNEELVAAKKELFNLRFQNATNQLDNTSNNNRFVHLVADNLTRTGFS